MALEIKDKGESSDDVPLKRLSSKTSNSKRRLASDSEDEPAASGSRVQPDNSSDSDDEPLLPAK
eukprot:2234043-Rhodomonas_salina.1